MKYFNIFMCISLLLVTSLYAGNTGKISGQATDAQSGNPLPGANVVLEGTTMGAATDADGYYSIIGVPPGEYTLVVTMIGYAKYRVQEVRVQVDLTTKINAQLKSEAVAGEQVTVVAQRPIVRKDETSTAFRVGSDDIDKMPVENVSDILNLQAGVVDGHFRGGRSGEVMYMVDGIPINDVYSGEAAFQVEKGSIQELQVISGTFNAEYGQAMSGVVNIVTKQAAKKFSAKISSYIGEHVSNHNDVFWHISDINPVAIRNIQGNFSVPLKFMNSAIFLNARKYTSNGWMYGHRIFVPSDSSDLSSDHPDNWVIQSTGDSSWVPMNPEDRFTVHGKWNFSLNNKNKFYYSLLHQDENWKTYDHQFRLNPDGQYGQHSKRQQHMLSYTHVFGEGAFIDIKFTRFYNDYTEYVYKNPHDSRYVSPDHFSTTGSNAFVTGGMRMWHFSRKTTSNIAKVDLKSQITKSHQIQTGVEAKFHEMNLEEYQLNVSRDTNWEPKIPSENEWNHNAYTRYPEEFAYYLQDKMEFEDLIVNAGVRFDYFKPDGVILANYQLPDSSKREPVGARWQISPRLGIAYPITAEGAIHVSYGHFFQIPNYQYLYVNPEFEVFPLQSTFDDPPQSALNIMGNASLQPQKTVIYEIGLKQGITQDLGIDVTGFYKDIRNLVGTQILYTIEGNKYARYINRDYGQVKGVTFSIDKRVHTSGVGFTLDYTYQVAKGNASDPLAVYHDNQTNPPIESEKQMVPLDWDQTHSLNLNAYLVTKSNYEISLIGQFGSGLPYTPTQQNIRVALENSQRKPSTLTFNLMIYKHMQFSTVRVSPFLKIYNLFDRLNELQVYTDSGRAGYTLHPVRDVRGVNTFEEYIKRPDFYSEPRRILLGVEVQI